MTPDFERLYRATTYAADTPLGRADVRVGRRAPLLDDLLDLLGRRHWAIVTAWNPRSQRLDDAENGRRHGELLRAVGALPHYAAENVPDDPKADFRETALLVVGLDADAAAELGRRFEQHAVVAGECGGPARLVACRPPDCD